MTKEELALLGFSEEDVLNRLVDRLCERLIETEECYSREFGERLEKAIRARADEVLAATMEKHVLPKVTEMIENVTLQETNKWGEARGQKLTFIEFLTLRADAFIREEVDYQGKAKGDDNSYGWRPKGTRIAHMIHEHLRHNIEKAMTDALGQVNSSVRKGLQDQVNLALQNIKVTVNTKVERD